MLLLGEKDASSPASQGVGGEHPGHGGLDTTSSGATRPCGAKAMAQDPTGAGTGGAGGGRGAADGRKWRRAADNMRA